MSDEQDEPPWPFDQDLPTQPRRQIFFHWLYFIAGCAFFAGIFYLIK